MKKKQQGKKSRNQVQSVSPETTKISTPQGSNNEEVIDIEYSRPINTQGKKDETLHRGESSGVTTQDRGSILHDNKPIPADNHPEAPRGKNKVFWTVLGMIAILVLINVSFITSAFYKKILTQQ